MDVLTGQCDGVLADTGPCMSTLGSWVTHALRDGRHLCVECDADLCEMCAVSARL